MILALIFFIFGLVFLWYVVSQSERDRRKKFRNGVFSPQPGNRYRNVETSELVAQYTFYNASNDLKKKNEILEELRSRGVEPEENDDPMGPQVFNLKEKE